MKEKKWFGKPMQLFARKRERHMRRRQRRNRSTMFFMSFWAAFIIVIMTASMCANVTATATDCSAERVQKDNVIELNNTSMIEPPVTRGIHDVVLTMLSQDVQEAQEEIPVWDLSPEEWNPGDVYFLDKIGNTTTEENVTVESAEVSESNDVVITSEYPLGHITYEATEEDTITVARVIYVESRGETVEGQIAVGATILNRYYSTDPMFAGKTIIQLCKQRGQFCYKEISVSLLEESGCMESARRALKGEDPTRKTFPETGAMYFYNPRGVTSGYELAIRTGITEMIIGNHNFHVDFNE